jgi:hypothetical protein
MASAGLSIIIAPISSDFPSQVIEFIANQDFDVKSALWFGYGRGARNLHDRPGDHSSAV